MSVVAINIEICNTALGLIGGDEINSFEDETREARLCNNLYPRISRSRLEMHPWRFCMKETKLSPIVGGTPLFGYENSFQLPADRLRGLNKSYSGLDYRILGDKLYANGDEFGMEYHRRAPEELWSESFRHLMELEMAAILSIGLFEDEEKAKKFDTLITRQGRIAKSVNDQQQPGDAPDEGQFSLTAVRP